LRALVQELVEGMLAHGALGAEQHRRRGIGELAPLAIDTLAVRFHLELLEVRREQPQRVGVRQHGVRWYAEEVRVPGPDERHQHWDVLLEGRLREVLVDLPPALEELLEGVGPDGAHRRYYQRRQYREAAVDPVPHREDLPGTEL